jgi:hypothetical protein
MNKEQVAPNALSAAEIEALLQRYARSIEQRKLTSITLMLLEMHRPLTGLMENVLIFSGPLLAPLVGFTRYQELRALLRAPKNVDRLIEILSEEK